MLWRTVNYIFRYFSYTFNCCLNYNLAPMAVEILFNFLKRSAEK